MIVRNNNILIFLFLTLMLVMITSGKRMGGGGGYQRRNQDYWRRRPWEVGYYSNRNNPRKPWESSWKRQRDNQEDFIRKKSYPERYEEEEPSCTGLCLLKKIETVNKNIEKKKKEKKTDTVTTRKISEVKTTKAPCTGMCAIMRRRTG